MTISELALGGKAAILVPSPNVAENHQYINAKALYDAGAASLIEESKIKDLEGEIVRLLDNAEEREKLKKNIPAFAKPDANKIIYDHIVSLVK